MTAVACCHLSSATATRATRGNVPKPGTPWRRLHVRWLCLLRACAGGRSGIVGCIALRMPKPLWVGVVRERCTEQYQRQWRQATERRLFHAASLQSLILKIAFALLQNQAILGYDVEPWRLAAALHCPSAHCVELFPSACVWHR